MCFSGDTLLPLLDGKSHALRDLAERGGEHLIYSCSESGRVRVSWCTVFGTSSAIKRCIECRLDDGSSVVCSEQQLLMRRDGAFASACTLEVGASLMPLYMKRDKDGYVLVQQNYSGRFQKAHWIVARCGFLGEIPRFEGQRTVIHHRNFDEADNRPPNLEFMGDRDHSGFHRSISERNEHWQSEDFEAKRVDALARKASTPEGHAYFAQRGTANITRYMADRPEHFRAAVAGNGRRGAPALSNYNTSEKGRAKSRELANALYQCETCGERVKSYIGLHNHRKGKHGYNHSLASVRVTASEPLYCIYAPEMRNVAISAGIFVHACAEEKS